MNLKLSTTKTLAKDILLYVPVKLLPALTIFFVTLYFGRVLTGSEYLKYTTILTILAIAVQFGSGWLASSIIFYLPVVNNKKKFITNILFSCSIFSLIFGVVGSGVGLIITGESGGIYLVVLICIFQSIYITLNSILQAEQKISSQIIASTGFSISFLFSAILIFEFYEKTHVTAIVANGAGYFIGVLLISRTIINDVKYCGLNGKNNERIFEVINYGLPLSFWAIAMLITGSGEKFFPLKNEVFYNYVTIKDLLIGVSSLASMPIIMAAHSLIFKIEREGGNASKLILYCCHLVSVVFGVLWCMLYYIGFDLINDFTQKNPFDILIELSLLFMSLYIAALSIYIQKPLEIAKRNKLLAMVAGSMACVVLPLFHLYVPKYGAIAASVIVLGAQVCYITLLIFLNKNKFINTAKTIFIYLSTCAIGHVIYIIIDSLIFIDARHIEVGVWLVAYLALVLIVVKKLFSKISEM